MDKEILFVGTTEAEHVEMYLKAVWHIQEKNMPVKVNGITKMLKKLRENNLVICNKEGVD